VVKILESPGPNLNNSVSAVALIPHFTTSLILASSAYAGVPAHPSDTDDHTLGPHGAFIDFAGVLAAYR
jgi:hypothetical protein